MINIIRTLTFFGFAILSDIALAKNSSTTLSNIAGKLSFGAGIMAHIMWAACIIVGIILIAAAFSQYQIHRYNPKFVPLGIPITYLLLGLIALTIPFLEYLSGIEKDDSVERPKQPPAYYTDIDRY